MRTGVFAEEEIGLALVDREALDMVQAIIEGPREKGKESTGKVDMVLKEKREEAMVEINQIQIEDPGEKKIRVMVEVGQLIGETEKKEG